MGYLIREGNRDLVVVEDLYAIGPGSLPESPSVNADGLILDQPWLIVRCGLP